MFYKVLCINITIVILLYIHSPPLPKIPTSQKRKCKWKAVMTSLKQNWQQKVPDCLTILSLMKVLLTLTEIFFRKIETISFIFLFLFCITPKLFFITGVFSTRSGKWTIYANKLHLYYHYLITDKVLHGWIILVTAWSVDNMFYVSSK